MTFFADTTQKRQDKSSSMKLETRVKEPEKSLPYHGTIMTETVAVSPYYRIAGKFRRGGGGGGGFFADCAFCVAIYNNIIRKNCSQAVTLRLKCAIREIIFHEVPRTNDL